MILCPVSLYFEMQSHFIVRWDQGWAAQTALNLPHGADTFLNGFGSWLAETVDVQPDNLRNHVFWCFCFLCFVMELVLTISLDGLELGL